MNLIYRIMSKRRIKLDYKLDEAAKVARIFVNKAEPYWTEEDRQQVEALRTHFQVNLAFTVLVES